MNITGDKRILASLYPLPLAPEKRDYVKLGASGAFTNFSMPPFTQGGPPATLEVFESWSPYRPPDNPQMAEHKSVRMDSTVNDLLFHWRRGLFGAPDGLGPAVWCCERTTEIPAAAPQQFEIDREMERQVGYFRFLYQTGQNLAFNKVFTSINGIMKAAGRFLGKSDDWIDADTTTSVPCIFCTKMVPLLAYTCPNCDRWVKEPTEEMKKLLAIGQPINSTPKGMPFQKKVPEPMEQTA